MESLVVDGQQRPPLCSVAGLPLIPGLQAIHDKDNAKTKSPRNENGQKYVVHERSGVNRVVAVVVTWRLGQP